MIAFSIENKNDRYRRTLEFLRYGIFIVFYILSVRLVFVSLYHAPLRITVLVGMAALAIAILSWQKIVWSLYGFLIGIPLVSGLQIIGFMQPMPLLSVGFASIYLSWFSKRLLRNKEYIIPRTGIGNLVDVFSAIVMLSLITTLWPYPLDFALYRVWFGSLVGQNELFYGIEGAYILLQGLFFFRMMEMEVADEKLWRKIVPILYVQASIIILFSLLQLAFHIPGLEYRKFVYSPFNDIHSYGSYALVLFFVFLGFTCTKGRTYKLGAPFMVFFFIFIVLSGCNGTLLAMLITGSAFLAYKLRVRRFIVLVCLVLTVLLYLNLVPSVLEKSDYPVIQRYARSMIVKNAARVLESRFLLWDRACGIIREFPITGSGIGTFYRISPLYHDSNDKEYANWHENAHNYYLQLGADLGIPALLLFLGVVFYTYMAGFWVLSQSRESKSVVQGLLFGLTAYLITMLSSHPLLLSNQQFLFWFVISAITIPYYLSGGGTLFNKFARHSKVLIGVLAAIIVIGYGYNLYRIDAIPQRYEFGAYGYENWKEIKTRWTMKKAATCVEAKGSLLAFDVFAAPHNIGTQGLNLKVFVNNKLWDEVNFLASGWKHLSYYMPSKKNEVVEVKTVVSKTFNPYRMGFSKDNRDLGVAVREIKFLDKMPKEGVGFYHWETWGGGQIPGWPQDVPTEFRWTGMRASLRIDRLRELGIEELRDSGIRELRDGGIRQSGIDPNETEKNTEFPGAGEMGATLFLMCAHPEIEKDPVFVNILGDGRLIRQEVFSDNQWRRVILTSNELKVSKVLTLQVNRTWNPRLSGVSEDGRDLGVAVAVSGERGRERLSARFYSRVMPTIKDGNNQHIQGG